MREGEIILQESEIASHRISPNFLVYQISVPKRLPSPPLGEVIVMTLGSMHFQNSLRFHRTHVLGNANQVDGIPDKLDRNCFSQESADNVPGVSFRFGECPWSVACIQDSSVRQISISGEIISVR